MRNRLIEVIEKNEQIKFSDFDPKLVVPALSYFIEQNKEIIDKIVATHSTDESSIFEPYSGILHPLEDADDKISRLMAYVSHIKSVKDSDELRPIYNTCNEMLVEFGTEVGQSKELFNVYKKIQRSHYWDDFDDVVKKSVKNTIRGFKFSGIDLPEEQQSRFKDISKRLSALSTQFSQNVMDCEDSFVYNASESEIEGLPEIFKQNALAVAKETGTDGYALQLTQSVYGAVLTFCKNRSLREHFYKAKVTVASDQPTFDSKWDNTAGIKEGLNLKLERAKMLGFDTMADLSLAKKMAKTPSDVIDFLSDIASKVRTSALRDVDDIKQIAKRLDGIDKVEAWDYSYYSELLKQERFSFSDETVREYFPLEQVISGLFSKVSSLYDIAFEQKNADVWDDSVRYYEVMRDGKQIASFYFDLFSRKGKRGGAWMAEYHNRRRLRDGSLQLPVTFLTCNFNPSHDETVPALLSHDDVITLFHEFGHGLHHMLTRIDIADVSGINGVQWDAVELPSQFMENWCWVPEVVLSMSSHYQTGEPLPADLLNNMIAAKNFQSGMFLTRQVVMSLFDMKLYNEYDSSTVVHDVIDELYRTVAVINPPQYNRFECSFMHIFGGGYAAGYYSYLWAEVLSADVFARFEEEGLDNRKVSRDLENTILARGGSEDAMDLFIRFRGREPTPDAFLRHSGIIVK